NLDPTVLYAEIETIKKEAKQILESYGQGAGHIFNLGHGILPNTDPEKAKTLVQFIKKESGSYH
ncbi:MAG TPA: uroporphyrinogen decarboxylase family protein, partial [Ignavibacteriaceae bacterium]|nr:uroporphyrinogen decarboxylase family protein [Ignavibacteriaceae bacterium]